MKTIEQLLSEIRPEANYNASTNFVLDELLDSLDMISLISSLEKNFSISINGADIIVENFISVGAITQMVKKYTD